METPTTLPNGLSLEFAEGLYLDYLKDPGSVPADWRASFESLDDGADRSRLRRGPSFRPRSIFDSAPPQPTEPGSPLAEAEMAARQDRVDQLVRAYRVRGHMAARLDPLGIPRPEPPELLPEFYGFTEADLLRPFSSHTIKGPKVLTLRQILDRLRKTWCRSIGAQFMHIDDLSLKRWIQDRMEGTEGRIALSRSEQLRIFTRLVDASIFEEFLQKKYLGAKSFSLEGAESLIPLLDLAIERSSEHGVEEIVLGMAHRGRLNVLANVLGKSPREIFREFEDKDPELHEGRGDVKYHLGYSSDWTSASGRTVHLSLCFNPSHLEFVDPVALGRMRAKQDRARDAQRARGLVLLIHGDAAFAGEGVVQESLNLSQLPGFTTGGTVHVVVNNQLGFTTPPEEGRSCVYPTDVARMLQVPIFHVNGEDPEAVAMVVQLAMDFRREFHRDVFIDMYCYRRRGHNEGDEPAFTQPLLYRVIDQRKTVRESYLERLLDLSGISREEADAIVAERQERLERDLSEAKSRDYVPPPETLGGIWARYHGGRESEAKELETGVPKERLSTLMRAQAAPPEGFHCHPKIQKLLLARRAMSEGKAPLDWSAAEALAFASLATEGISVRLTGQDTARGTFSQRHAVLHDVEDGRTWIPLQHLADDQAPVEVFNSPLSEVGVLGFEYGYSLDCPDGLVVWEAQFGDFCNAAQVIVDQFLVSAEEKWRRLSGLTLFLPHGFEGMGPEHSSARVERFLNLAVEDNIQVCIPTTPAQLFHLLRRQALRRWRKPLVVMTPKSLLRSPKVASSLEDLTHGRFLRILPDEMERPGEKVRRAILCAGKIYYELSSAREELARKDTAILRVEQLYPFPEEELRSSLASCPDGTPVVWVQEEPENMGAWRTMHAWLGESLFGRLPFSAVTRPASSTPATGSARSHKQEQRRLLEQAFGGR